MTRARFRGLKNLHFWTKCYIILANCQKIELLFVAFKKITENAVPK